MTDYEPYVRDPAERPPARLLQGQRTKVGVLAALVLVAAVSWIFASSYAEQDPALEVPLEERTEDAG
jgi:hypothetical protein